jgi:hypothetical protein
MEQPNMAILSSDSFMLNLGAVLLNLCEPFLDPKSKKYGVKLINEEFLRSDTTILPADMLVQSGTPGEDLLPAVHLRKSHKEFNFVTRCFFLTLRCLSLGLLKLVGKEYPTFMYYLQNQLRASRGSLATQQIQMMLTTKLAMDCTVLDPRLLGNAMKFVNLASHWWLSLCCPSMQAGNGAVAGTEGTGGLGEVELPLPKTPPAIMSVMPQHFVEDILDLLKFLGRYRHALPFLLT